MQARLLILIAVALGLVVYYAAQPAEQKVGPPQWHDNENDNDNLDPTTPPEKTLICDQKVRCVPTAAEPEVSVQVSVDRGGKKNRLVYNITESHGYYVDSFKIKFWHKPTPDTSLEDAKLALEHYANEYLLANGTLTGCLELPPAELIHAGGAMGTDANWGVELMPFDDSGDLFCRACAKDPNPLPVVVQATAHGCD